MPESWAGTCKGSSAPWAVLGVQDGGIEGGAAGPGGSLGVRAASQAEYGIQVGGIQVGGELGPARAVRLGQDVLRLDGLRLDGLRLDTPGAARAAARFGPAASDSSLARFFAQLRAHDRRGDALAPLSAAAWRQCRDVGLDIRGGAVTWRAVAATSELIERNLPPRWGAKGERCERCSS